MEDASKQERLFPALTTVISSQKMTEKKKMALQILLADDHATFRQSLRALLEREGFTIVGEACDGREALKLARECRPDVAVLDLAMPVLNGLDAAREMPRVCPATKTILLTAHFEIHYILEAFRSGISGYVVKRRASEELVRAITEISHGRTYLCALAAHSVLQAYMAKNEPA